MSALEEQATEWEVLESIYEGDDAFKKLSDTRLQYRIDSERSFVIEIDWPADYPNVPPRISLDIFYNSHICEANRSSVRDSLLRVAEENVGMAVSFTLIEYAKEHAEELTASWIVNSVEQGQEADDSAKDDRKENLTKAAKRRMWDRAKTGGELERGHDWVDIIKHLSQIKDT